VADSKETALAITIRAVDRATAVIRAIGAKIGAIAKPTMGVFKDIGTAIGAVLSRVTSVIGGVLDKIPLIGTVAAGALGGAIAGMMHLINQFDDLGDKADRFGVSVDFLASMRYAAEKAGAPVEALDNGLLTFSVNMGKLSANSGRFKKFLDLVSPALEQQLKKAKSNEEAFYLLAAAMDKLKDPAKRAALAAASGIGPELAPLLAQGQDGVKKLAARYIELAGSQEDAAKKAGDVDDSMHDLHASVQGAEAAIVSGLAPSMRIIVDQLRDWFVAHRGDIAEWAANLGEKIPGAFKAIVEWVGMAIEKVGKFFGVLEKIYDTLKDIWDTNDAHEQAKKAAASIPAAQAAQAAKESESLGKGMASGHDTILSAVGGLLGLGGMADTDIGREATRKVLNVAGVNDGIQNNIYVTGEYQRELAKQLREKAAAAVQGSPATEDAAFGSPDDLQGPSSEAKITVDFKNVPRGARVATDPGSTADVDLNVGYQMGGAQ
jgi:hypothetical protein